MRTGRSSYRNMQLIPTRNAGRWMQQNRLANCLAFRVERFLHPQRPMVSIFAQHCALTRSGET
jgi:hypothetical protein